MILFFTNHTILNNKHALFCYHASNWLMERAFLQLALYIMSFVFGFIQVVQIVFIKKLLLLKAFFPTFFNLDVLLRILVRHNQKILYSNKHLQTLPWCDEFYDDLWVLFILKYWHTRLFLQLCDKTHKQC